MPLLKATTTIGLTFLFFWSSVFSGGCQSPEIARLNNKEFKKEASKENVIILDVRTPKEFAEGHIQNALLMDYLETETFIKQLETLDTSKTYLLYCRTGKRSYNAAKLMKEKGFKMVCDLKEGISKWDDPVIKGSE